MTNELESSGEGHLFELVFIGTKKRRDLIATKCQGDPQRFDDWLNKNRTEVQNEADKPFRAKVAQALWVDYATDAAKSVMRHLPTGDDYCLNNQYDAWTFIIGNSPASRQAEDPGGGWLALWNEHRINVPDNYRTFGNW